MAAHTGIVCAANQLYKQIGKKPLDKHLISDYYIRYSQYLLSDFCFTDINIYFDNCRYKGIYKRIKVAKLYLMEMKMKWRNKMISEFIYLEIVQKSDYSITYTCNLPDPDIYGDFKMVLCGHIILQEDFASGDCMIRIELMNNFEQLCVGDVYNRNSFLVAVLNILRRDSDFRLEHAKIILKDFMGSYVGGTSILDKR